MAGGKIAAGLVIFRIMKGVNEFLMLQTSYGSHHWTPPKGHMDAHEKSEMVTALRETQEESGYGKEDLKVYDNAKQTIQYMVNGKPKTVIYWLAQLTNVDKNVILSDEHQDYKWLPISEACKFAQYDEMIRVLKYFDDFIKVDNK